jgi:parallel beta-helix repeat protein
MRGKMVYCVLSVFGLLSGFLWTSVSLATEPLHCTGSVLYVGGSGPGNYSTIQDAIDNATNGSTVYVYQGIYDENIIIPCSIAVIGENRSGTLLQGNGSDYVVQFLVGTKTASFSNFTIENKEMPSSYNGIFVQAYCEDILISNNILIQPGWREGICIWSSMKVTVRGNIISHKESGVQVQSSEKCLIDTNTIINNDDETFSDGIIIEDSSRTTITNNIIQHHPRCGIYVDFSSSATVIKGNDIRSNRYGIALFSKAPIITQNNIVDNNITFANARYGHWSRNYWGQAERQKVVQLIHGLWVEVYGQWESDYPSVWFDLFPARDPYIIE